jgi:VNT family MFS transporter (synaptic vesicle glycoprotein 2)
MMVWFPEYTKLVSTQEYDAQTTVYANATCNGEAYNTSFDNVRWIDSSFKNCSFHHLTFNHVSFDNCTLYDVRFEIIKSSRTYFRNSTIKDSRFDAV